MFRWFSHFKTFLLCLSSVLSDLSEQIKAATKENHVRAENTQLMLSYQKGQITVTQYKVSPTLTSERSVEQEVLIWFIYSTVLFTSGSLCVSGAALFPLWDLHGSGGGAGQKLLPSSCCTDLLPSGTLTCGISPAWSGVFLWLQLEEEGDRSCCHSEIRTEDPKGDWTVLKPVCSLRLKLERSTSGFVGGWKNFIWWF